MNPRITLSRLERLRQHLRNIPDGTRFDMFCFHRKSSCGTAACAWGHATSEPSFQKLGLRLRKDYESSNLLTSSVVIHSSPHYKGLKGFHAAEAFFGLSNADVCYLFDPGTYESINFITPQDVIIRIGRVMRRVQRRMERAKKAKVPA